MVNRRGRSIPLYWIILSLSMGFVILRLAQGQPSVYFKANPAVKSLPRIGRRSDLETFPLPLSSSMNILSPASSPLDVPQGSFWSVENYLFRNDQQFKPSHTISGILDSLAAAAAMQQQPGQASLSSAVDSEHILPNQLFWRKFIGDPEVSENSLMTGTDNSEKNIYRSRSRK